MLSHRLQVVCLVNHQGMLTQSQRNVRATVSWSFEQLTRKMHLKSVMKPAYQESFVDKVTKPGELTRNVIVCTQIFINKHAVQVPSALDVITQRNLWYSICQLIMGQLVTNKDICFKQNTCCFQWNETSIPVHCLFFERTSYQNIEKLIACSLLYCFSHLPESSCWKR